MKSYISNFAVVSAVVLPSCASSVQNQASKPMPFQAKSSVQIPLPPSTQVATAAPLDLKGTLVLQRGEKLEAIRAGQKAPFVLRGRFRVLDWNFSPDGKTLCFAQTPEDVDFFDAGAVRSYLFTAKFNSRQNVLLAAYGKKRVPAPSRYGYSFGYSTWSRDGKKLVVTETLWDWYGNEPGPTPSYSNIALYDARTRRQLWNSDQSVRKVAQLVESDGFVHLDLFNGALSSDGNDVVCGAAPFDGSRRPSPAAFLVHFDLKRKKGEVLTRLFRTGGTFEAMWHPTQKKVAFVGSTSPKATTNEVFVFDLSSKRLQQITSDQLNDSCPQWALDGRHLFWIRNGQILRANADGSNPTPILPQIQGVTRIQLLPKIADWSRYRKLSIEPLAGKDK